jgi:Ras-related protein Rab-2A
LLVYDITRRSSFLNAVKWLEEMKEHAYSKMLIILVGNKKDLEQDRQVSFDEGERFAKSHGLNFFETSAKTNEGVGQAFT